MHDDIHPTPLGLLRCLQALSEEAASLGLTGTAQALHQAIEACRIESAVSPSQALPRPEPAPLH
jgi:hypothetical protein